MAKREEFQSRKSRQNRYFSKSFKQKKVKELDNNLVTIAELSREYQVSRTAIYKWLHKYSLHYKKETKQVVEAMSDTRKVEKLKERNKELEQALGRKQIQLEFYKKLVDAAEEEYSVDIKKKYGLPPYDGSG